jgi:hypothetical protein
MTSASIVAAAPDAGVAQEAEKDKVAITSAMRLNFGALMTLQPYLLSSRRFSDPANAGLIREQLDILQQTPHVLSSSRKTVEPGLGAISGLFGDYLATLRRRFDRGQTEFARSQLLTATSFCAACHTRIWVDKDFEDVERQVKTLRVSDRERADLYAATRQFDSALALYERVLRGKVQGEEGYYAWTHAARSALRITVRVKNSPDALAKLIASLEARTDLPSDLRDYVAGWRSDLTEWQAEKTDASKLSPPELVKKARELIGHVDGKFDYELPDIPQLRATQYLHEALSRDANGKHRAEALFLLGLAYSGPQDPLLWELDGLYFEACVRENPRTEIARRCFKRLQNELYLGYSGSAGTNLPSDELERLAALRKIAF